MAKAPAFPQELRDYFAKEGRKGGKLRAKRMSPEQRKEVARKAAQARWQKEKAKKSTPKPSGI